MKVCIEKDQSGQFSVYQETEEQPEAAIESQGQEQSEQQGRQQARDLNEALQLAGKLLSQEEVQEGPSPFDMGLAKTMPNKTGAPLM